MHKDSWWWWGGGLDPIEIPGPTSRDSEARGPLYVLNTCISNKLPNGAGLGTTRLRSSVKLCKGQRRSCGLLGVLPDAAFFFFFAF